MTKLALIAAIAVGIGGSAMASDLPGGPWRALRGSDGSIYRVNIGSIERKITGNLPSSATVLIYRDTGASAPDLDGYSVMQFDCRGHFLIWNKLQKPESIRYGSAASLIEDAACWGAAPH